jgi:hypothetical protein
VSAEEDRRAVVDAAGQPAEQIADRRVDLRTGVVLLDVEAEGTQLGDDAVGNRALPAGRALDRRQLQEERERIAGKSWRAYANLLQSELAAVR